MQKPWRVLSPVPRQHLMVFILHPPSRTPFLFPAASSASRSRIFSRGALRRGHGFKVAAKKQRVLNGTQVAAEGVKPNPSWLSNKQTGGVAVQKEKRC